MRRKAHISKSGMNHHPSFVEFTEDTCITLGFLIGMMQTLVLTVCLSAVKGLDFGINKLSFLAGVLIGVIFIQHDKLGHNINGSVYQLEAIKVLMEKGPETSRKMIQAVIDQLRSGMDEIRGILKLSAVHYGRLAVYYFTGKKQM